MFSKAQVVSRAFLAAAASYLVLSASAGAATIAVGVTADTFIETGNFDSSRANGFPLDDHRFELYVYDNGGAYHAIPLLRFDLSSFAGQTVQGNATLTLSIRGSLPDRGTRQLTLVALTSAFDANTASWDNSASKVNGSIIGSLNATPVDGGTMSFTLAPSVVQNWINSTGTNYGFGIVATPPDGGDIYFFSAESGTATQPTLTFTTVPEPSTLAIGAVGALGLMRRRRKAA